jgi:ZIP family zinc transporter
MLGLVLAAFATTFATGLGAIPVFALGDRVRRWRPALLGFAAGVMGVAAIAGLLLPGLEEGAAIEVWLGVAFGVGFLLASRRWLVGRSGRRELGAAQRLSLLVFAVLFVHSLPEGFAIGTAYASETEGLGAFVILAIALQNIPEGTSVAIPMAAAGQSAGRQFWAAVATSAPQPVGAVVAYVLVEEVSALLPASFGFAAGAMLALVAVELLPEAVRERVGGAAAGTLTGALLMAAFGWLLGV